MAFLRKRRSGREGSVIEGKERKQSSELYGGSSPLFGRRERVLDNVLKKYKGGDFEYFTCDYREGCVPSKARERFMTFTEKKKKGDLAEKKEKTKNTA